MIVPFLACVLSLYPARLACCRAATSHKAESCPFCGLDVIKDTDSIRYKVVLEATGKKISYRCVLCAVADAKGMKGNLKITAPSEDKDKPVVLARGDGAWKVEPETAEFVYVKGSHEKCQMRYRAITKAEALEGFRKTDSKLLADAKGLKLDEFLKKAEQE